MKRSRSWLLPVGMIAALTGVFFFPVWGLGQVYVPFDILCYYLPWYNEARSANNSLISDPIFHNYVEHLIFRRGVLNGALVWWRGDQLAGLPFYQYLANPFRVIVFSLLPVLNGMMLMLAAHMMLAGVMMYLFLSRCRMNRMAALTGAVAWMFNGYVMVWFEFEFSVAFAAVLPAALYCCERWWTEGGRRNWVGALLCHAYAVAIAFPHLLIYYFLMLAAYILWRGGESYRAGEIRGRSALRAAGWKAVRLGLTLPLALPTGAGVLIYFWNNLKDGQREALNFSALIAGTGQVHGRYLLTLFYPELFSSPLTEKNFTPALSGQIYNNFNELCVYAGYVTLVLAVMGAVFMYRRPRTLFFIVLAVFSLWSSMGGWVYYPLARWVPGLGFSTPTRLLFFWGFALAFLAGAGMQTVMCVRRRRGLQAALVGGFLTFALALAAAVNTEWGIRGLMPRAWKEFLTVPFWLRPGSPHLYLPLTAIVIGSLVLLGGILIRRRRPGRWLRLAVPAVLGLELMVFAWRYNSRTRPEDAFPPTPAITFLQAQPGPFRIFTTAALIPNSFSPLGLENVCGYQSVYPRRYGEYMEMAETMLPQARPYLQRMVAPKSGNIDLLSMLNVGYILAPPGEPLLRHPALQLVYDGEIRIYRNRQCLPRAYWVPSAVHCDSDAELRERLCHSSRRSIIETVLLEGGRDRLKSDDFSDAILKPPQVTVRITGYRSERIELETASDRDGYLVVSNSYDPGWKARIDGRPVAVMRANYALQAIALPAGSHRVTVVYDPEPEKWLLWFGYLCWGGWLLAWVWPVRKRG